MSLIIEWVDPATLTENPDNPKKYTDGDVKRLAMLVEKFEYMSPLKINEDGVVIDGHRRLRVAKLLGITSIPVIRVKMSEAKALAYIVFTKNEQNVAKWDDDKVDDSMYELLHWGWNLKNIGMDKRDLRRMEKKYIGSICPKCSSPIPSERL